MHNPNPIIPDKVRTIPDSFSWIDRRFITKHFINYLNRKEIALYFFLVTASNRHGMSFYSFKKIGHATSMNDLEIRSAIISLREMKLIAFNYPFFQVLTLPEKPVMTRLAIERFCRKEGKYED